MLAPTPPVPNNFWDLAMAYACRTHSFNFNNRINDSPYHYVYGEHIDIKDLHPFWAHCHVYIPLKLRQGKLNSPRAYKAHFVGYNFSTLMFPTILLLKTIRTDCMVKFAALKMFSLIRRMTSDQTLLYLLKKLFDHHLFFLFFLHLYNLMLQCFQHYMIVTTLFPLPRQ